MSLFGGTYAAAANTVTENLQGNIIAASPVSSDFLNRVTVKLGGSGVVLRGVIYGPQVPEAGMASLIGRSVIVTKAGGRWVIL